MTNNLERLVLSTARITEEGYDYHLEIRKNGKGYSFYVMQGKTPLFTEPHDDIGIALREFYEKYVHSSATEKMHGP